MVGQNILEVLDYQNFRRRDLFTVIGTNSIALSPNNFNCDNVYLVHNTNANHFKNQIYTIIKKEKPNLILSGRDEDTVVLSLLMEKHPELTGSLPYGKSQTLKNALYKWDSWKFCKKYNLPFASSYLLNSKLKEIELKIFVGQHGYPLIAKPNQGFASNGVFFIRSWKELLKAIKINNYILQEYLGDAKNLKEYFSTVDNLTPLFMHAPNVFFYSCHTMIYPDGKYTPIFILKNDGIWGGTICFNKVIDKELEHLTIKFVEAIANEGGYGPLTVQFRKDKNEKWKAQEINMRTNGNTFPRFLMGQDDIGLIFDALFPKLKIPIYKPDQATQKYIIHKQLSSKVIYPEHLNSLETNKYRDN